jgi:hypothetical protein
MTRGVGGPALSGAVVYSIVAYGVFARNVGQSLGNCFSEMYESTVFKK